MAMRLAVVVLCFFSVTASVTRTNVARVPGFDGALPSRLQTGYVTVDEENGAELFYYFIESEGDPGSDPVLLWITGGDRCSVLSALFFEIGEQPTTRFTGETFRILTICFPSGPLKLVVEPYNGNLPRLRYHPYTWTKVANLLFVDSPVGAGFSFSRDPSGYDVGDVSASLQLVKFLSEGYLVGNPSTGESIDYDSKVPYAHGVGIISDQLYELLEEGSTAYILGRKCIYVSPRPNYDNIDRRILKEEREVIHHPPPQPSIKCKDYSNYLSYFWANNIATREALGIRKGTVNEWVRCHDKDLPYTQDISNNIKYHRNVTLKGYRALAWVRSLNYPIVDDWRAWHLDGQSAGFTIAYGNNLTFATVKGGGHTAPEYEPERCFAMFSRWISDKPL
ncbi:hypothetical protein GUJ93_ZPchr0011g28293 [Zizania palustris]|uniref:Serine carboxypeptidase-like 19 n=1 Tax=Zizania palustris TaxID=103762 RepID=A0A8J5WGK2_ZIZPA|nr:hypothetical protein GUJ93_ZPchr0011g28293 [Zizania palustris]